MKKVLILIRDKFGDSLIAAQTVLALRDQYPKFHIILIMRSDYAYFLKDEPGIQLIPYRYYWQVWGRILLSRLAAPFDAFIVLRGFGAKIAQLGKLIRARRKIYMKGSFPHIFSEYPKQVVSEKEASTHIHGAWQTLRLYAPELRAVPQLQFPSLVAKRKTASYIGICPLSDEARRNLSPDAVRYLIQAIQRDHPGQAIYIVVRTPAEGVNYRACGHGRGVQVIAFKNTRQLLALFTQLAYYYGTDTGLYHLAAAMDIPATVLFGPTQPYKVILPAQRAISIRIEALGERHCDEKGCQRAVCLELATRNLLGTGVEISIVQTPIACPLRGLSTVQLHVNQALTYSPVTLRE